MAGLAAHGDGLSILLHDLVAAEATGFRLLGMKGRVKSGCPLLARLVVAGRCGTAPDLGLAVPVVMTGGTFDLCCIVLSV